MEVNRAATQTESDLRVIIEAANREIVLLNEFHTRLIADVVTGKLDIREVAASLPDNMDSPGPLEAEDDVDEFEDSESEDFEPEEAAA